MASFTSAPANWTNSSDANFRSWGSLHAAKLLAVGLVQTSDTGQINWTTVLAPLATNTYQGYEIWRFADSLQATFPVFLKIEYGSSAAINNPSLRIQIGSGSNGSGTLTGNLSAQYLCACAASAGAVVMVGSGSTNRFAFMGGFTAAGGYGMYWGVERSKDAAGADTSEAILGVFSGTSSSAATSTRYWPVWSTTLGDIGLTTVHAAPAVFTPQATALSGAQVVVSPILHSKGIFMNPGLNFLGYYPVNIAANGTPSIYMYGATHVYYSLPASSSNTSTGFQGQGGSPAALAIRYE